jgi:hypothetical protein
MSLLHKNIGIVYNFPAELNPLAKELLKRGLRVQVINSAEVSLDPSSHEGNFSLLYNDLSVPRGFSSSPSGPLNAAHYSRHFEDGQFRLAQGRIVNRSESIDILSSRSRQLSLFSSLNIPFPTSRVIYNIEKLPAALNELNFPVLVKTNNPFATTPILRFNTQTDLLAKVAANEFPLTGGPLVIQEYSTPKFGATFKVDVLNGRFLSATKVTVARKEEFHGVEIDHQVHTPEFEIVAAAEAIAKKARVDLGTVEYFIEQKSNTPHFFAITPLELSGDKAPLVVDQVASFFERRLSKIREMELAL